MTEQEALDRIESIHQSLAALRQELKEKKVAIALIEETIFDLQLESQELLIKAFTNELRSKDWTKQDAIDWAFEWGLKESDIDEQNRIVTTRAHLSRCGHSDKFIDDFKAWGRLLLRGE